MRGPTIKYKKSEVLKRIAKKNGMKAEGRFLEGLYIRTLYGKLYIYIDEEMTTLGKIRTLIHEYLHWIIDRFIGRYRTTRLTEICDEVIDIIDERVDYVMYITLKTLFRNKIITKEEV